MKKILSYASMMLAATLTYSCAEVDNPVPAGPQKTVIELDGQKYETDVVAKLKAVPGSEIKLTLGVYDNFDIYGVDFGDGVIVTDTVCQTNSGLRDPETGLSKEGSTHTSATEFAGTAAGEGEITVYGNSDLWLLSLSGDVVPVSYTQEKLKNVQSVTISGANIESADFAGLDSLRQLSISNTPIRTVNVSKNPELTSVNIICTTVSVYEPQLESLDLSANTALETIVVSNNALTSAKLPVGADVTQLSLDVNELESVDLSVLGSLKNIQINDNKLKSIDLSKMVEASRNNVYVSNNQLEELTIPVPAYNLEAQNNQLKKVSIVNASYSCKLENNQLTLATLPAKPAGLSSAAKTRRFTYAPQAPIQVAESLSELDLTDQLSAQGILDAPATTTFSFATASGTALVEGTDYQVTAPGKFTFLTAQNSDQRGSAFVRRR